MRHRLPMTATGSRQARLLRRLPARPRLCTIDVARRAAELAAAPDIAQRLAAKRAKRQSDEAIKPLAAYRQEELQEMRRNFYGFDPSYHVARYHFVTRTPHSWTPRHLARHRDLDWKVPE
jgi:putative two-component system hydrogenase maturation factor HypX/HoxX